MPYVLPVLLLLLLGLLVRRRTVRALILCLRHGHHWHEGEDTYLLFRHYGAFRWGTYLWRCRRCGKELPVGSPPPPDASWDPTWCSPSEGLDCAATYRR